MFMMRCPLPTGVSVGRLARGIASSVHFVYLLSPHRIKGNIPKLGLNPIGMEYVSCSVDGHPIVPHHVRAPCHQRGRDSGRSKRWCGGVAEDGGGRWRGSGGWEPAVPDRQWGRKMSLGCCRDLYLMFANTQKDVQVARTLEINVCLVPDVHWSIIEFLDERQYTSEYVRHIEWFSHEFRISICDLVHHIDKYTLLKLVYVKVGVKIGTVQFRIMLFEQNVKVKNIVLCIGIIIIAHNGGNLCLSKSFEDVSNMLNSLNKIERTSLH